MILREARPPRRTRSRWPYYIAALAMGTGLGAILFYGWVVVGTGLALAGAWIAQHTSK